MLLQTVAEYYGTEKNYTAVKGKEIHWPGGAQGPPPDTPACGFDGSKCPKEGDNYYICSTFNFPFLQG